MMVPLPPFEPDRALYAPDASSAVTNVMPVRDGWGPLPDLSVFTDALPAAPRGAIAVMNNTGAWRIFAGTEAALYELNTTDYSWTDRTGPTTPAVPSGDTWWFEAFGDNLFCGNLGTDMQSIAISGGTAFADVSGSPPRSKYAVTAGEYLLLGHIQSNPRRIQTSGLGDATHWTVGERGCDFQDFPDGGDVQGLAGAERGAIVFQQSKLRQMTIAAQGAYSFSTQIINPDRGVLAPRSIAQIGPGRYFYFSADGFMVGVEGRPIGAERVDRWFQDLVDITKLASIKSVADPFNKIVWTQADLAGSSKILVGYNWQLDRWCPAEIDAVEMLSLVTPTTSWDGLDTLYATIDAASEPFDSAQFAGGIPRFGAFDTDNKLGMFTGTNLAATLETADIEMNPGRRSFLREVRAFTDSETFTMEVGTSDYHGGTRTWSSEATPFSATKICHFRLPARLHRFRMKIPAGTTWEHVSGLDATGPVEGNR